MSKNSKKTCFLVTMLVSGTFGTLTLKQLSQPVYNGESFTHPYFMAGLNFFSECFCLVIFRVFMAQSEQNEEISLKGKLLYSIPALLETFTIILSLIGLSLSTASIYQMMRGFIIIVTFIYSLIFLKAKILKHQILSLLIILVGLVIIGTSSILSSSESAKNPALGLILIIISQFFGGGKYVTEQYLFKIYKIHPMRVVGLEGISGLALFVVLLPVLNLIPCDDQNICNQGYIENTYEAFSQISNSLFLFFMILVAMSIIVIFSISGVTMTKLAGAVARTTIDICRMVFVWLASIMIGWETFSWLQFCGFIILVYGTLAYNEIVPIYSIKYSDSESNLPFASANGNNSGIKKKNILLEMQENN